MAQVRPVDTVDQTAMLPALGIEAVQPALSVTTANMLVAANETGEEYLVATAANGLSFQIQFQSCEAANTGCKAMLMLALWEGPAADAREAFMQRNTAFALSHPMASAGLLEDGSAYVARYVIADYGIPQGNLVSEFANFVRGATDFHNQVVVGQAE